MLPTDPYAKFFNLCEENEFVRMVIDDELCFAIILKRNFRTEILAFVPRGSVVLISPHIEDSSALLPIYNQSTVLSYGTDWRIELDHASPPNQILAGEPASNGSIVITTFNGQGGRKDSRAYLAVGNSKIPNLLIHFLAKDRLSSLDRTSFEFTSWSIVVPAISALPMYSHR